jgi:hypothetical protein
MNNNLTSNQKMLAIGLFGLLFAGIILAEGQDYAPVDELFYPTGVLGDTSYISIDEISRDSPHSGDYCIKIDYRRPASSVNNYAIILWQYPENNWGEDPQGRDMTGAKKISFYVRGKEGGEWANFLVGGMNGTYGDTLSPATRTGVLNVPEGLSPKWTKHEIPLEGKNLSHIITGFGAVVMVPLRDNSASWTIYLDDIQFEY